MKKFNKVSSWMLGLLLTFIALLTGAHSGVMLAEASALPDAGISNAGDGGNDPNGIATESQGRQDGDPEFYTKDIDRRIAIDPRIATDRRIAIDPRIATDRRIAIDPRIAIMREVVFARYVAAYFAFLYKTYFAQCLHAIEPWLVGWDEFVLLRTRLLVENLE